NDLLDNVAGQRWLRHDPPYLADALDQRAHVLRPIQQIELNPRRGKWIGVREPHPSARLRAGQIHMTGEPVPGQHLQVPAVVVIERGREVQLEVRRVEMLFRADEAPGRGKRLAQTALASANIAREIAEKAPHTTRRQGKSVP